MDIIRMLSICAALACLIGYAATTNAQASDLDQQPMSGYLLPSEKDLLTTLLFDCEAPKRDSTLKCSFTDIDIRHKIPTKLSPPDQAKAAQQFFGNPVQFSQACAHLPAPDPDAPASAIAFQAAWRKLCTRKDNTSIEKFFAAADRMEAATCKIATAGTYQTKFRLTADNEHTRNWTATNGPEGSCGVVTVEALEISKSSPLDWTYRKQENVTTPSGNSQCAALKTTPHIWRWTVETRPAKCEFVVFQPTFLP